MNEKHYIMIFYALLIWFHFKLIVKHKPEDSLLNIFIYDLESTCNRKVYNSTWTYLLILAISFDIIIISNVMGVFYFRILDKSLVNILFEVNFSEKLFINKHSFKAIGYITLSLTMINSERSIYTDFITLFFVSSVGSEHEYVLFREFLSEFYFECTNT